MVVEPPSGRSGHSQANLDLGVSGVGVGGTTRRGRGGGVGEPRAVIIYRERGGSRAGRE